SASGSWFLERKIVIEIVALSEAMREAVGLAERVAPTDANVLVTGESGAGKDALAWFIHAHSLRAAQPLVKIDCATLPADLLEAELFGYERRAFRDDLFYRLNVVHIIVPPLRERSKDLETLGRMFVQAYAAKHGRPAKRLSAEALALLRAYDFPGNVREFGNIIERAVIVSIDAQIA